MRLRRYALLLVASLVACATENPVVVRLDTWGPLSCVDSRTDSPLVARAIAPAHRDEDVLLVFDFVRTPSFPRCREATILAECEETGCAAIPEARSCLRVPRSVIDELDASDLEDLRISDLIAGQPLLLPDAPRETVIVRLAIGLEGDGPTPCDDPTALAQFDERLLLGCGYSCPVVLDHADEVEVDLDAVVGARACDETVVNRCARLGL